MKKGIGLFLLLSLASFAFGQVTTEQWLILNTDPDAPSYMSAQDLRGVDYDAASFWNTHINTVSESWLYHATDATAATWQATGQARGVDVNTASTYTGNTVLYADNANDIVHVHDAATGAYLWDLDTTGVGSVFTGHTVSPYRIAVSQDGQVFVNSFDGIIVKWANDASTTPPEIVVDLSGETGNSRALEAVGSGHNVRLFFSKGTNIRVFDDDGSGNFVEATNRTIATGWTTECEAIASVDSNLVYAADAGSGQDQTVNRRVYELTASGYVNNTTLVDALPYGSWFVLQGIDVGANYFVITESSGAVDGFGVGTINGTNYSPITGDTDGDYVYDAGMNNPALVSDIALDAASGMVYWTAAGSDAYSGIGSLRINTYGGNTIALSDDDNNAVHIQRADNGGYLYDLSNEGLGDLWTQTAVAPYRVAVTSDGQIFANTFDGKVVRWVSDADTTKPEMVIDLSGEAGNSRALEAVGNGNGVTVYLSKGTDIRAFQDDGTGTFVERTDMTISAPFADEAECIGAVDTNTVWLANALGDPNRAVYNWNGSSYELDSAATSALPFSGFVAQGIDVDPRESLFSLSESGGNLDGIAVGLFDGTNLPPDPSSLDNDGDGVYDASGMINGSNLVTDVAIDTATNNVYWTSSGTGGGIGMLKAFPPAPSAQVTISAQIGGDSQYRSFWVNGSWDADGAYDSNWSGPMVELTDPDGDHIFTGTVSLQVDDVNNYSFWVGSENDVNSWLEDGTAFSVTSSQPVMTDTVVVDPSDAGYNNWVIGLAGDFNGWDNSADNLTRDGQLWSTTMNLTAGTYAYKYTVMHSWTAAYGQGGIGSAGGNYSVDIPTDGDYTFTFNDADNSVSVGNPVLFASTDSIGFGQTALNSIATIDFHLRNDGDAALYVTNVAFADSNYFTTSLGDTSIAPDSTLYANVYFTPTMEGSFRDTLFIETNAGNHQIILTGTGYNLYPVDWRILATDASWLGTSNSVRTVAYSSANNHVYVLSRVGGTYLKVFDANTGDFLYDMNTEGISGGTFPANMVAATKDGQVFVGNLALAGANFKLYRWKNDFDHPMMVFDGQLTGRAGDALTAIGAGDSAAVLVSGSGNEYINVLAPQDSTTFIEEQDIPLPEAGAAGFAISPIDTSHYGFITAPGVPVRYIDGNTGTVLYEFPPNIASGSSVKYFKIHRTDGETRRFIAVFGGIGNYFPGTHLVELLGTPGDSLCSDYESIPANTPTYSQNDNLNGTGELAYNPYTNSLIEMATNNGLTSYDFNLVEPNAMSSPDFLPIAQARIDANGDYMMDRIGDTVTVYGYINSINFSTSTSYYMEDGMAGLSLYSGSLNLDLNPGDVVRVTGELSQYRGLGEITPMSAEDVTVFSSGSVPDTTMLTIPELGEPYESMLVKLNDLSIIDPENWPAEGSNGSVLATDGTDTVEIFIDKETALDGWTPPTGHFNLIGVEDQYTYSDPPNDGYEIRPRTQSDFQIIVGVKDGIASIPKEFKVYQNYPNPFNPTTNIKYDLPKQADVKIIVYNMLGQKVRTLVNQHMEAGYHEVTWNSTNDYGEKVSTGLYIYRVIAGDKVTVKKMLLIK